MTDAQPPRPATALYEERIAFEAPEGPEGTWLPGLASITDVAVFLVADEPYRSTAEGLTEVGVPYSGLQAAEPERGPFPRQISLIGGWGTIRVRCRRAKAFAAKVLEAAEAARGSR